MSTFAKNAVKQGLFTDLSVGTVQICDEGDGILLGFRSANAAGTPLDIDVVTGRTADGDRIIESQPSDGNLGGTPVMIRFPESHDVAVEIRGKLNGAAAAYATLQTELAGNTEALTALATLVNLYGIPEPV